MSSELRISGFVRETLNNHRQKIKRPRTRRGVSPAESHICYCGQWHSRPRSPVETGHAHTADKARLRHVLRRPKFGEVFNVALNLRRRSFVASAEYNCFTRRRNPPCNCSTVM